MKFRILENYSEYVGKYYLNENLILTRDKIVYRGEDSTFSSKYKPYAGLFFGPTKYSVSG